MPNETEKTETPKAAKSEPAKSEQPKSDPAVTYSVDRLLEDADLLVGSPRHVVAGALYGAKGDMTVDQAQAAVKKFLDTEVKEG